MRLHAVVLLLAATPLAVAAEVSLPLPNAPVRVVIPDVTAFDAALTGQYRRALTGTPDEQDPVARAWRRSPVGSKLEAQWQALAGDLPWTWEEILKLKPSSLGLSLLAVGHLEAVMVIETPLATVPLSIPAGESKSHGGAAYQLVARGAADPGSDPDRRMGLAWARAGGRLFLATSERALKLALDESRSGRGFAPPLPGFVSLELDLDELRKDLYFRREFLFGDGPERGRVKAALRLEAEQLVEVREGSGSPLPGGVSFVAAKAAAAGWEPDGATLWPALRSALLEPIPSLSDRPVVALASLPSARSAAEDRYLVSLERPVPTPGQGLGEEGELAAWRALWSKQPLGGWGYSVDAGGARRLVFAWPEARQGELEDLCRATAERRAGHAAVVAAASGGTREVRVGPELPVLALRRTGGFVWLARSARELADVEAPRTGSDLVRWARVDLGAVKSESARWAKAEGPPTPEQVRPLSDRVLGVLGWMPATTSLSIERRNTGAGWTERIVFGTAKP